MFALLILVAELTLLFFLSGFFINSLFNIVLSLTKSSLLAKYFVFFTFLPGILVHELSHYIFAKILFVRTGNIRLVPRFDQENLMLGSVDMEKTDFIRRMVIGFSPIILGIMIILGFPFYFLFIDSSKSISYLQVFIFLFAVFEIANTMFSSRKDVEGVGKLIVLLILVFICLPIVGFPIMEYFNAFILSESINSFIKTSSIFLSIPIFVDLVLIAISRTYFKTLLGQP